MSNAQRTIDSQPVDMWERDAIKRFAEGLSLTISGCREMEVMEPKKGWKETAEALEHHRLMGIKAAKRKAITRQELLVDALRIQGKLDTSGKS